MRSQSRRVRKTPSLARSSGGAGHSVRRRIGELFLTATGVSGWIAPVPAVCTGCGISSGTLFLFFNKKSYNRFTELNISVEDLYEVKSKHVRYHEKILTG